MFTLVALGAIGFMLVVVIGALMLAGALVGWALLWPFRLVGIAIKGVLFLLALPLIVVFAIFGLVVGGFGLIAFLIPIALLVLLVAWLVRHNRQRVVSPHPAGSQAPPIG